MENLPLQTPPLLSRNKGEDVVDARRGYGQKVPCTLCPWTNQNPNDDINNSQEEDRETTSTDKPEPGFKKGHCRNDSGHVVVTGSETYDDTFSPIVSSDEEGETTLDLLTSKYNDQTDRKNGVGSTLTFQEKSDEEGSEKKKNHCKTPLDNFGELSVDDIDPKTKIKCSSETVNCRPEWKGEKDHASVNKNAVKENIGSPNEQTPAVYPVAIDIGKLGKPKLDSDNENPDGISRPKSRCSKRQRSSKSSKWLQMDSEAMNRCNGAVNGATHDTNIMDRCPSSIHTCHAKNSCNFVNFADAIQDEFAYLVKADFETMELCDYLYQYKIMNLNRYEEFFELSQSTTWFDRCNLRRKLMLFLSRQLPRDTFEVAVSRAGCFNVFMNVLKKINS